MGKVFVYNSGKAKESPDTLNLSYGLFFDGTLNNRENTKIWKKVRKVDGYKNPTEEEEKIFKKNAQKRPLFFGLIGKRRDIEGSYINDFSNVARKSMSCKEPYTIYVEGIGTEDREGDSTKGFAYGKGDTGVPSKVTKGCDALAKRVNRVRLSTPKPNDIDSIIITVDVFGFSRGAAAARYFVYNLQKAAYAPLVKYSGGKVEQADYIDHEGIEINNEWLENGRLPRMGNFGISLLKLGIDHELIANIRIQLRFLGIYDTVASYDPDSLVFPSFREKIKKLHMDELGNPRKIVHFTSLDEHRKYFPLTRIQKGDRRIERNFPGVHSDIGGSYTNYSETGSEIRTIERGFYQKLSDYRELLIQKGWFKEEEIQLISIDLYKSTTFKLQGERNLRKEYSYIFLHFMRDESAELLGDIYLPGKIDKDYSIAEHETLVRTKKWLQTHTLEEGKDWMLNWEKETEEKNNLISTTISSETEEANLETTLENEAEVIELDEVVVSAHDLVLKRLRNRYLHWSGRWEDMGHGSNANRERAFYNADGRKS